MAARGASVLAKALKTLRKRISAYQAWEARWQPLPRV